MKINELRIGNYVKSKNYHYEITEIWNKYCKINDIGSEDYDYDYPLFNVEKLMPIPLNEEWLINLGFNKQLCKRIYFNGNCFKLEMNNYNTCFYVYKYKRNDAGSKDEGWKAYIETDYHNEIKYNDIYCLFHNVHQLQNIYFTLTGKELTIKK